MPESSQQRVTNNDLALMIGQLQGQTKAILENFEKMDHVINGNGKKGLITDHRELVTKVSSVEDKLCAHIDDHTKQMKKETDKKEKWSTRTWAIVVAVIGAFITNSVGLIFLFIRTGAIK
jgi:hypothetical protein